MSVFIGVFIAIVIGCVWLVALVWLIMRALDATYDSTPGVVATYAACCFALFALPIAAFAAYESGSDPNANRLCRRGHQEWVTRRHPMMLVGKVFIPARTTTEKLWMCDEWEAEQAR